jgi:hypothetical protein
MWSEPTLKLLLPGAAPGIPGRRHIKVKMLYLKIIFKAEAFLCPDGDLARIGLGQRLQTSFQNLFPVPWS